MSRIFFFVVLAFVTMVNAAMADRSTRETLFDHCAVLTWPDGHETRLRGFHTNVEFVEACASKGNCKVDGKKFATPDELRKAVTDATMECLFPPLGSTSKNECTAQKLTFTEELRNLAPSLGNACQRIFLDPIAPIFPSIEAECKASGGADQNWCMAQKLATFYLRREQVHEFVILFENLTRKCPAPQLREYFKARLYYLATRLDTKEIPSGEFRDFDFGPVDATIISAIRANGSSDTEGKEYSLAIAKHHPRKHLFLADIQARCQAAQPGSQPDAAR